IVGIYEDGDGNVCGDEDHLRWWRRSEDVLSAQSLTR
ncbi:hypothetical protein A2U01_0038492, partial [Trifolium medium]|nr:hypothetical protein [Trifolium medium]